jgi:hypothetical protein
MNVDSRQRIIASLLCEAVASVAEDAPTGRGTLASGISSSDR